MILRSEDIKDVCSKILNAVDASELSMITETLELITEEKTLLLNVTNREYYAQVKLPLDEEIDFHATVNANLFLKLISQITTDTIELSVKDTVLEVKGNGKYKLPLIYEGEKLLELPKISMGTITSEFDVKSEILLSILNFNSKELTKGVVAKPVQKLYYVDEQGAITFTTGACVNKFNLPQSIKILLKPNIVKLFKLFKEEDVHLSLGHDVISTELTQTVVKFSTSSISLIAILTNDDSLTAQVPASAIRGRALDTYAYSVTLDRNNLLQTINRLMLFSSELVHPYSKFEFSKDKVTIWDSKEDNNESIFYDNDVESDLSYTATLDLLDLKLTLENSPEHVTINFGNHQAVVIARGTIYNVIPEVRTN